MKFAAIKVGAIVFDSWWPIRLGRVARVTRSGVRVEWSGCQMDGREVWTYDREHVQFLRPRVPQGRRV